MKQNGKQFVAGFLCGAIIFGATGAYAAGILATPNVQRVFVDGKEVDIKGYHIDGNNYFKLRDVGKTLDVAVNFDTTDNSIQIQSNQPYGWQEEAKESSPPNDTVADVTVKKGSDGRPLPYNVAVGERIYGTGNITKSENPYAASEYDGYMEIKDYLKGTPFPVEPLQPINPNWDESYYSIKMPNPVPCYTHTLAGQTSTFLGMEIVDESDTYTMYVFNARETQRIIDELYSTFLEHPECYTNGKLNCAVAVGLTASGFEGNFFYPYRDSCVEMMVYGSNIDYLVYAVDTYVNGVFNGTKYICQDNCDLNHPDVISSDTAIMKDRQIR